jgi:hypothetical protein
MMERSSWNRVVKVVEFRGCARATRMSCHSTQLHRSFAFGSARCEVQEVVHHKNPHYDSLVDEASGTDRWQITSHIGIS